MHDIKAIRDDRAGWVAALKRRPAYASEAAPLADRILEQDKELRDVLVSLLDAARLFAPQKGASPVQVEALVARLSAMKELSSGLGDARKEVGVELAQVLAELRNASELRGLMREQERRIEALERALAAKRDQTGDG